MAFVTVRIKGVEGYFRRALDKDRIVIGRTAKCDLMIEHPSISREHCVLTRVTDEDGERWSLEDLGSQNGTRIGDTAVAERSRLHEKDLIKCGRARLTFHHGAVPSKRGAEDEIPVRHAGPNDPPLAIPCSACNSWLSVAHRDPGEHMPCPHCGADLLIPDVVEAVAEAKAVLSAADATMLTRD